MSEHLPVAFLALCLTVSCATPYADSCDHTTAAGACVSVVHIFPWAPQEEVVLSNVDAFQGECVVQGLFDTMIVPEPFTDHPAQIAIANRAPAGFDTDPEHAPKITVDRYTITYSIADCPAGAVCPDFDPFTAFGPTVMIRGNEEVSFVVPMVPLRRKLEYVSRGGRALDLPSYAAYYTIGGFDADGELELSGSAEFTIGNFSNCPASGS